MTKSELDLAILKKNFSAHQPSKEQIETFVQLALELVAGWEAKYSICRIRFSDFLHIKDYSQFVSWYAPALQRKLREFGIHSHLVDGSSPCVYITAYDMIRSVENYDQKKNLL